MLPQRLSTSNVRAEEPSIPKTSEVGVQVIDWGNLSAFVDDLLPHDGLPARRNDLLGTGPAEAIEIILLANHLLRIVDARAKAKGG